MASERKQALPVIRGRMPSPDDPEWLRTLLAIHQQRGWSQTQLAHELGVSVSTVANWESGRVEPRPIWVRLFRLLLEES